jgi:hypothetical protein
LRQEAFEGITHSPRIFKVQFKKFLKSSPQSPYNTIILCRKQGETEREIKGRNERKKENKRKKEKNE